MNLIDYCIYYCKGYNEFHIKLVKVSIGNEKGQTGKFAHMEDNINVNKAR